MFEAPPDALRVGVDDFGHRGDRGRDRRRDGRGAQLAVRVPDAAPRVLGVAAAAAVYLPSLAIVSAFDGDELEPGQTPQVLLSAFWAIAGLAGIVVGLLRDVRLLRLGGLALLLLAAVKVFAYDLSELESIYRALSFIALGLLLLGGAFAYQRIRKETASEAGSLVVALLVLVAAAPASALDASSFRWERALADASGLTAFEPDGPMYEHAAIGFADLRVLDARERQVPWRPR